MATGILIGVITMLSVVAIYFWIVRPQGQQTEMK